MYIYIRKNTSVISNVYFKRPRNNLYRLGTCVQISLSSSKFLFCISTNRYCYASQKEPHCDPQMNLSFSTRPRDRGGPSLYLLKHRLFSRYPAFDLRENSGNVLYVIYHDDKVLSYFL